MLTTSPWHGTDNHRGILAPSHIAVLAFASTLLNAYFKDLITH